ncbi:MAG: hypothetical protein NTZ78_08135 [Candidatus Aureabacteria bacterium]|nr:hypothetical protein [Candidatus Auribacterota bacterium]
MTHLMRVLVATLLCASSTAVAMAGTSYKISCQNEKCGFKGAVDFGGGFKFEQITGYCTQCRKFVYLQWPREEKGKDSPKTKPKPIGLIWDATAGHTRELYVCPHCKKAFFPILSEKELRFCPNCGQESLKLQMRLLYD